MSWKGLIYLLLFVSSNMRPFTSKQWYVIRISRHKIYKTVGVALSISINIWFANFCPSYAILEEWRHKWCHLTLIWTLQPKEFLNFTILISLTSTFFLLYHCLYSIYNCSQAWPTCGIMTSQWGTTLQQYLQTLNFKDTFWKFTNSKSKLLTHKFIWSQFDSHDYFSMKLMDDIQI